MGSGPAGDLRRRSFLPDGVPNSNANGQEIWVWEQGVGIVENGFLEALEGLMLDITARKLAEQARQLSKDKLSQIIMGSPVAAFVIDEQHIVTHWNQACSALTGIPAESIVGTNQAWKAFIREPRPVWLIYSWTGREATVIPAMVRSQVETVGDYRRSRRGRGFDFLAEAGWEMVVFHSRSHPRSAGTDYRRIETLQDFTERKRARTIASSGSR